MHVSHDRQTKATTKRYWKCHCPKKLTSVIPCHMKNEEAQPTGRTGLPAGPVVLATRPVNQSYSAGTYRTGTVIPRLATHVTALFDVTAKGATAKANRVEVGTSPGTCSRGKVHCALGYCCSRCGRMGCVHWEEKT